MASPPTPPTAAGRKVPELVLNAISFAARQHRHGRRKDKKTPYVAHPMRVLFILSQVFGVEHPDVLAAAVLHDTIEDTTTDRDDLAEEFNERVAELVSKLTKDKRLPEDRREVEYLKILKDASIEVKLCKLADTLDNLIDSAGLPEPRALKAIRTARKVIEAFETGFPREWRHALELVRAQLESASSRISSLPKKVLA